MNRKIVRSSRAPQPVGPYSQAVVHGGLVYASGQIPLDPQTGEFVSGDIFAHTRQALRNLEAVLQAAGTSLDRCLKITVYLSDLLDFPSVNRVFEETFPQDPPARSLLQAAALPKGARVEIDAVAALPEGKRPVAASSRKSAGRRGERRMRGGKKKK